MRSGARSSMSRCSGCKPLNRKDENYYLSDGRVTLMIIPWRIADYYAQDPARTGLDHIGFEVESVEKVKKDMEFLIGENPHMRGRALGVWVGGRGAAEIISEMPARVFPSDRHRGRAHRCRGSRAVERGPRQLPLSAKGPGGRPPQLHRALFFSQRIEAPFRGAPDPNGDGADLGRRAVLDAALDQLAQFQACCSGGGQRRRAGRPPPKLRVRCRR